MQLIYICNGGQLSGFKSATAQARKTLPPIVMTKDTTILFLTIATFVSFNADTKSDNKKYLSVDTNQKTLSDSTSDLTKKLIGEWGIYVTITYSTFKNSTNKMESACNSCPTIKFSDDQTATIAYTNGDKENMKWRVKNKMLTLVNNDKSKKGRFFSDTAFAMTFKQEKQFIELELTQTQKKYSYILRR